MSDINQNVNINVNANTQDASQDIEKLEKNIATLDGAINIVGGSVEVLAGSLALTGAVTEEQAARFESAAVGAIALADGSKRIIEGYKTLASQTKVLTVVQRIYNTVLKANPVFVIIGVLAAVAAGVAFLTSRLKEQREEQERLNAVTEQANKTAEFYDFIIKKAIARGESQFSVLSKQAAAQRAVVRGLEAELEALEAISKPSEEQLERLKELPGLIKKAGEDAEVAQIKVETEGKRLREERAKEEEEARKERARKRKEARDKEIEEEKAAQEEIKAAILARYQAEIDAQASLEQAAAEGLDAIFQSQLSAEERELNAVRDKYFQLEEFYANDAETLKIITEAREKEVADIEKKFNDERVKQADETKDKLDAIAQQEADFRNQAINDTIDATQGALTALFGENKAIAKANVLIDAAQASVGIIKSAQNFKDPTGTLAIAYIVSQFALLAATTAGAIQQINSAQPGGGGGGGGAGAPKPPALGVGAPSTGGIPQIPGTGTSGVQTLNAVVLAGDVTSAQAQDAAIRNRRSFGG